MTAQCMFLLLYLKEERENPSKRSRLERDIDNNLITSTPRAGEKTNKQISRVRRKSQVNGGLLMFRYCFIRYKQRFYLRCFFSVFKNLV